MKMVNRIRIASVLAIVAVLGGLALAACGAPAAAPLATPSPQRPTPASVQQATTTAKPPPPAQQSTTPAKPTAPAWQEKWDAAVATAKKEEKVVIYTSANPATRQGLADGFQKKFGVVAEITTAREEEFAQKILSERRAGLYLADVIIGGPTLHFNTLKPQNVLQDLTPMLILPEVTDVNLWRGKALPIMDQEKQVFAFVSQAATLTAVNTDAVKENDIKSYKDVLNPRWKDRIVMDDPTVAGAASSWTQMMLAIYGQGDGRLFLENLMKQNPVILRDKRLEIEGLARGKYDIAIGADIQTTGDFIKLGSPVRWLKPVEGGQSLAGGGCVVVLTQPAHPNATIVFVNWLLSKEGQSIFAQNYGAPSARADVPTEGIDPSFIPGEGEKLVPVGEQWYRDRPKVMQTAKEIFGPLMK